MYELTIGGDFSSAHYLKGYDGSCQHLHGHTWKVEVTIVSGDVNAIGLVCDFREMKKKLKVFLAGLDHVCLNDLPAFADENPTTENLAKYIYKSFAASCVPFPIQKVQVWESDTSSVTYYE